MSDPAAEFFRALLLDREAQCSVPECGNVTRCAAETRDQAQLPYCSAHMHVVFSQWMVGVWYELAD